MAVNEERKRPIKLFEVVRAYGPYRKGDRFQPTGMYRDRMLRLGLIREVTDSAPAVPAPETRQTEAPTNRMVDMLGASEVGGPALANRKSGRK